ALCITATIAAGLAAQAFAAFSYILGLLDGCDVADAWPRLRNVLGNADRETKTRFVLLAVLLAALASLLWLLDAASSVSAQLEQAKDAPVLMLVVPLFSTFL